MSARGLFLAGACLLAGSAPGTPWAAAPPEPVGRAIYLGGVLASGAPLQGRREAGGPVTSGADAACVNCHQRSGLGSLEGQVSIPPITGEYLFRARGHDAGAPALPYVETVRPDREPYTEATLARAIREGLDAQGRPLSYLMPRFALGDDEVAALIRYLRSLGARQVPGVTDTVLHFATIVTPDADPLKRQGTLDVLEHYFEQKNRFPLKPSPPMRTSGTTQRSKSMYMANRRWQLHVWELAGPPSSWREQLERHLAAEPVYAVISGVGGGRWAEVHAFCEEHAVPCLLPNVEVPVVAERDFYPLYFSKGVLLEAELMARALSGAEGRPAPRAVEQVYRAGDSGEAGAAALAARLAARGIAVHATVLPAGGRGGGVAGALRTLARASGGAGERAVALWLRPADLAALGEVAPPRGAAVVVSGLMGGLERAPVPPAWRERAAMTYPFDLPGKRGVRLDYALGWFAFRKIPVVAEQVQADTYLACTLLADVVNRLADNFARPYLVEQLQGMLEHRLITGYYPHLSLASNQRFASKGGYVVRFRDPAGTALVAESDWVVP